MMIAISTWLPSSGQTTNSCARDVATLITAKASGHILAVAQDASTMRAPPQELCSIS